MMKKVIEELKKEEMSVGKEIGSFENFEITSTVGKTSRLPKVGATGRDATHVRIGGFEAKGTEEKILGYPISKKAPHSMLGKKLERDL